MLDLFVKLPRSSPLNIGAVELDFDPAAERYSIFNRKTMGLIYTGVVPTTSPAIFIVPLQYTTSNDLVVMIFDDAGELSYNMVGADKVKAQLVDARTITTNP